VPESPPPYDLLTGASLFLDFDGTLVEIAERPDAVVVDPRIGTLLARLADRLDGRLALVSGRPAGQIRALLPDARVTVVGSHGMEYHHADGRRDIAGRPSALTTVLAEAEAFAAGRPGLLIEDKPLGVAFHYRQAPGEAESCHVLARELADRHGLLFQPGKMLVELRAPGGDKGAAVRSLMTEPKLASGRPLFMGDDETDEPGFAAAGALNGAGILVGPDRPSAASYRLADVGGALDWLEAAAERLP